MAFPNGKQSLLYFAMIASVIAACVLSVEAINCHQCNSHLDEDCTSLRLNTPLRSIDEQYLTECPNADAYCRKTLTTIAITGETRIVRSCGWHMDEPKQRDSSCIEMDVDGFDETICTCFHDGCNSAPRPLKGASEMVAVGLVTNFIVLLVTAAFTRTA